MSVRSPPGDVTFPSVNGPRGCLADSFFDVLIEPLDISSRRRLRSSHTRTRPTAANKLPNISHGGNAGAECVCVRLQFNSANRAK